MNETLFKSAFDRFQATNSMINLCKRQRNEIGDSIREQVNTYLTETGKRPLNPYDKIIGIDVDNNKIFLVYLEHSFEFGHCERTLLLPNDVFGKLDEIEVDELYEHRYDNTFAWQVLSYTDTEVCLMSIDTMEGDSISPEIFKCFWKKV